MQKTGTVLEQESPPFLDVLLSMQVMTGDDWVNQMNDYMEVYNGWLPP